MPSNTASNKYCGSGSLSYLWVKESYEKAGGFRKVSKYFFAKFRNWRAVQIITMGAEG
jgi:hypothetical protein